MKQRKGQDYTFHILISIILICNFFRCSNPIGKKIRIIKYNKSLHSELIKMADEEQKVFQKIVDLMKTEPEDSLKISPLVVILDSIKGRNTSRLKEIVEQYGWPGKSLVGEDGANAAWLLIQHADRDRKFQRYCLELMKEAAQKGEIPLQHVAYLTDRLLVAEGKKQIYGTQFTTENGKLVPFPIENEADVDKRRKEVGLPPLSEYIKRLKKIYQDK